ncbi:MAG: hypothetical protein JSR87_02525 [Proteobacteria bacterium]|nr:hypothetical protein [Pseudomonadota bacterium]MBS0573411.1 hypothetical protein [Pseudomonadota bacterium]
MSYGTFSCTLEGFDEPFSTMKAIAEYFRDLAADDRYFGAEPPTPDAEMLHRIAEKEIQRRVEAKISEYGVVLRQTEETPAAMPAAAPVAAPAAVPAQPVAAPVAAAAAAAPAVAPVAVPLVEAAAEAPAEMPAPHPTEATIESAVEAAVEAIALPEEPAAPVAIIEPVAPEAVAVDSVAAEPVAIAEDIAGEPVPEVEDLAALPALEPAPETAAETAADAFSADAFSIDDILAQVDGAGTDGPDQADTAPLILTGEDAAPAQPAAEDDSIAAKLMRIRAVVENVRAAAPAYDEDEPAAEAPDTTPMPGDFGFALDLSEDMPELEAAEAARAQARATEEITEEAIDEEFPGDSLPEPLAEADEAIPAAEEIAAEDTAAEDTDDADLLARLAALGATSAPDAAEPAVPAAAAQADQAPAAPEHHADTADATAGFEAEDEGEPEPAPSFYQRAKARVIRLSKAVTHSADAPEAEETEAAPAPAMPEDQPVAAHEAAEDMALTGEDEVHDDDPDVTRLMAEAKEKLEGAENRRRFSAISHLKAAVAATLADRQLQPGAEPTEAAPESPEIDLYREDLSKAVRPRRPTTEAGATTQRPSLDMRPAPLVLVSEQRVDRPAGDDAASAIRPRRVVKAAAAYVADDEEEDLDDLTDLSPEDVSSFEEFAERLGATSLTELLEAAAAYTASVEGRESFSRPHLLRKVEFVSSRGEFSREDGMRSFGMLLRQGKLQKVARGQFTITDTSKFMHEARKAM